MIVHLSDIFYFSDHNTIENKINRLLDIYHIEHSYYHFFNDNTFFIINDPDGKQDIEMVKSTSKRSNLFIDVINILLQFYIKHNDKLQKNDSCYEFIRDCCNTILTDINIHSFKFISLKHDNDHPIVKFSLYDNEYILKVLNNKVNNGIKNIKLYLNANGQEIPLIKSKPIKVYGNLYIDSLYQMILYIHGVISFIKGNFVWDSA